MTRHPNDLTYHKDKNYKTPRRYDKRYIDMIECKGPHTKIIP